MFTRINDKFKKVPTRSSPRSQIRNASLNATVTVPSAAANTKRKNDDHENGVNATIKRMECPVGSGYVSIENDSKKSDCNLFEPEHNKSKEHNLSDRGRCQLRSGLTLCNMNDAEDNSPGKFPKGTQLEERSFTTVRRKIAFHGENSTDTQPMTDSHDNDDKDLGLGQTEADAYMPRRKKLRSEVTNEELWEGFQTVRFKRLTPIKSKPERNEGPLLESKIVQYQYLNENDEANPKMLLKNCETDFTFENYELSSEVNGQMVSGQESKMDTKLENKSEKGCYTDTTEYKRSSKGFAEIYEEYLVDSKRGSRSVHRTKSDGYIDSRSTHKKKFSGSDYADIEDIKTSLTNKPEDRASKAKEFVAIKLKSSASCTGVFAPTNVALSLDDKQSMQPRNMTQISKGKSESSITLCNPVTPLEVNNTTSSSELTQCHKETRVTPKRSARLQEKRENTPSKFQSHTDFIYTPLKRSEEVSKCKTGNVPRKTRESSSSSCANTSGSSEICFKDSTNTENRCITLNEKHGSNGTPSNASCNQALGGKNSNESAKSSKENGPEKEKRNKQTKTDYKINKDHEQINVLAGASLKIRVRKTESGASIISSSCHSVSSNDSTDHRRQNEIASAGRDVDSKGKCIDFTQTKLRCLSKGSSKNSKKKTQNKTKTLRKQKTHDDYYPKSPGQGYKEVTNEDVSPRKQTRSRTRSGEGEITAAQADPEASLKQPRSRGKVHPSDMRGRTDSVQATKAKKRRVSETENSVQTSSPRNTQRTKTKQSDDERLLKLPVIGKYACLLWSSENRRHFQQTHPNSSSSEVDEYMRKAWNDLTEKEKLKYYQRAYSATREENKHSNLKCNYASVNPKDPVTPCRSMVKFLALKPEEQHEELRKWLRLIHEISPEEYSKLVTSFKENLKRENTEKKQISDDGIDSEDFFCRKLLFQKVLDVREKVIALYHKKKAVQKELVKDAFSFLVKRLISGENVSFPEEHSEKLSTVLLDLRNLENEFRITVSGEPLMSRSYENLLEEVQDCENEILTSYPLFDVFLETDIPKEETETYTRYIQQLTNEDIPVLDSNDVDTFFTETMAAPQDGEDQLTADVFERLAEYFDQSATLNYRLMTNAGYGSCCELNSPSCILTNWLIADQFKSFAKEKNNERKCKTLIEPKFLSPFMKPYCRNQSQQLTTFRTIPVSENIVKLNKNNNSKHTILQVANRMTTPTSIKMDGSQSGIGLVPHSSSATSSYKHSLIQRKIQNICGQTVVRYTKTPIARDKVQLLPVLK